MLGASPHQPSPPYLTRDTSLVTLPHVTFADAGTEDIFDGTDSKAARKTLPVGLVRVAQRKLTQVDTARSLDDLRSPPGNRLKALASDRSGQHGIRINDQYRICFIWSDEYGAENVEITDYH